MQTRKIFLSFRGRISRRTYWFASGLLITSFVALFILFEAVIGRPSTLSLYPFFFWAAFAIAAKRYHDRGKSAAWLLVALIPMIGFPWIALELGFFKGTDGENRYGSDPLCEGLPDYHTVA